MFCDRCKNSLWERMKTARSQTICR